MAEQPLRHYVAVTVDTPSRVFALKEGDIPRWGREPGFIFHTWLRAASAGVVGVKFSSWMIKQGGLSPAERSVVTGWNRSESDFEVFFGNVRDYEQNEAQADETGSASLMRLDARTLALCFPIHGSSLGKAGAAALAATLPDWPGAGQAG
jgi:hypothetical protein